MILHDTIAALATPPGRSAIGIVRLSGDDAVRIVSECFRPAGGPGLEQRGSHVLVYGRIEAAGRTIDEVVTGVMRGPSSYTGEDTVEIYCHGGPVVVQKILETVMAGGARLAERGEFTRRAFLNGKMDLTQAEAVADLINAPTDRARQAAVNQLEGRLKKRLAGIQEGLDAVLAEMEASIEFPEDVVDVFSDKETIIQRIEAIQSVCADLLRNAEAGRILHDGYRVALAGKPNAGKSSLLNRLACEERALVTEIPGTTRDSLEADVNIEGYPVRLIDTAGLRAARGTVEQKGIDRAREIIGSADVMVWIADSSRRLTREEALEPERLMPGGEIIWVWNKSDLALTASESVRSMIGTRWPQVRLSALTGEGIALLHNAIRERLEGKMTVTEDQVVLLRARHRDLLGRTYEALKRAAAGLREEGFAELSMEEVREARRCIGEVSGQITPEELLDRIFADFCIGK